MICWFSRVRESGLLKYLEIVVLEKPVYFAISLKVIFFPHNNRRVLSIKKLNSIILLKSITEIVVYNKDKQYRSG